MASIIFKNIITNKTKVSVTYDFNLFQEEANVGLWLNVEDSLKTHMKSSFI